MNDVDDRHQDTGEYEATRLAPPPPSPSQQQPPEQGLGKVTLNSMLVEYMDDIARGVSSLNDNLSALYGLVMSETTRAKVLATVSIGIASVGVLLNIAVLALLAFLLGHVR